MKWGVRRTPEQLSRTSDKKNRQRIMTINGRKIPTNRVDVLTDYGRKFIEEQNKKRDYE